MGLTWNPDFVKSPAGMAQAGQVVFAFVGGIVNIFSGDGLLGFAFWDEIQETLKGFRVGFRHRLRDKFKDIKADVWGDDHN